MKKKTIVMSLVPFFALMACSSNQDPDRVAVPNNNSEVTLNSDGSYSQSTAEIVKPVVQDVDKDLNDSYAEAVRHGYKGTVEDWAKVSAMYEADPEKASAEAKDKGFDGTDLVLATLAGVALSSLAVKAASNHNDPTTRAYAQQRLNNQANYAYSQPYTPRSKQKDDEYVGSSSGGGAGTGGYRSTTASSGSPYSAYDSSRSYSRSSGTGRSGYTSVSRGGFGGAVGRGG